MSWKDRAIVVPATGASPGSSSWRDRAVAVEPDVSKTESGLRGAAQGLSFGFADEIAGGLEAAKDAISGSPVDFTDSYQKHRDESRSNYKAAEQANPGTYMAGQVAGAIAPAIVTGGGSTAASVGSLAAQGAAQGLGSSEADLLKGDVLGAAKDTAIGGGLGLAAAGAGKLLSKIPVGRMAEDAAATLRNSAEGLAERATGATASQAEKFAPGAGRELLDRGIVSFGDSAESIAQKAAAAKSAAGSAIDDALSALDQKGIAASVDNVASTLESKVAELSKTPGNEATIRQIQSQIDNLYARGESSIPISAGEQAKRNFSSQVNYFSPEAEKKGATHVAGAFRSEVEKAAIEADPVLAKQFTDAKKLHGILAPVEEAAEKRALQQAHKSPVGIRDVISFGAAGPKGYVANKAVEAIEKRALSSSAVVTDRLADIVAKAPRMFGKYAGVLTNAAKRGGTSLAAADFVLSQSDPEYRSTKNKALQDPTEDQE